jgi:hypothetical protein
MLVNPKNRNKLAARVAEAAERALADQKYVSPIDVLLGIGWLNPSTLKDWRLGRVDCLESVVQANLSRLSEAMRLLRSWAAEGGLRPSETQYVTRTPGRRRLKFSRSGNAHIEQAYRTHWMSPELSERKRERLAQKASTPPELVVIVPLKAEWACHRCSGSGGLLMMEQQGPSCLRCAGLNDLELLPAGDALLTRRAKARSKRHAVVVRFSRARKRYERQGVLVEPQALIDTQREIDQEKGSAKDG